MKSLVRVLVHFLFFRQKVVLRAKIQKNCLSSVVGVQGIPKKYSSLIKNQTVAFVLSFKIF